MNTAVLSQANIILEDEYTLNCTQNLFWCFVVTACILHSMKLERIIWTTHMDIIMISIGNLFSSMAIYIAGRYLYNNYIDGSVS